MLSSFLSVASSVALESEAPLALWSGEKNSLASDVSVQQETCFVVEAKWLLSS